MKPLNIIIKFFIPQNNFCFKLLQFKTRQPFDLCDWHNLHFTRSLEPLWLVWGITCHGHMGHCRCWSQLLNKGQGPNLGLNRFSKGTKLLWGLSKFEPESIWLFDPFNCKIIIEEYLEMNNYFCGFTWPSHWPNKQFIE